MHKDAENDTLHEQKEQTVSQCMQIWRSPTRNTYITNHRLLQAFLFHA